MKRILVIGGLPYSLVVFRGPLLKAMAAAGNVVFAAANGGDQATEERLREIGVTYAPVSIARAGTNPIADIFTLFNLIGLLRRVKPDIVLSYTAKPVIWGGIAARICGIPKVYSLITGLGYAFGSGGGLKVRLVGALAKVLYRFALKFSRNVFFQNPDDLREFSGMGLVDGDKTVLVNGSGVDLGLFMPEEPVSMPGPGPEATRFLLISRLLNDKGIIEYAAAAHNIRQKYSNAEFHLVGPYDPNPACLTEEYINELVQRGDLIYHGAQSDVRPYLKACNVYVLPSYREGTPRTVLEAMAMGRPVITTDAPGCRETVRFENGATGGGPGSVKIGQNGILVPPKDVGSLVHAMEFFLRDRQKMRSMGRAGRVYAEERYDVHKVNALLLKTMGLAPA